MINSRRLIRLTRKSKSDECAFFLSFRYLPSKCIHHVPAMLCSMEQWPSRGGCNPNDGSLCGNHTSRKQRGRPSLSPSSFLRTSGHESVNIVKAGNLKRGRCPECCIGKNRKRARVETVYACLESNVRLCHDKCHDLFHSRLTLPN